MPLVSFAELMTDAERGGYAVGYFECWDSESLLAVCEAAEAVGAPVLLGFSGIYLPHPGRLVRDPLSVYAALGLAAIRSLSVPACLVFNESPDLAWVLEAIRLGFGLVMFSDETLRFDDQAARVRQVVEAAHKAGSAVEGEAEALPGLAGDLTDLSDDLNLTEPDRALDFVERTGVDAFAVNVGQAHLHGRRWVQLDFQRIAELKRILDVPLVLHGASSVADADLGEAIRLGIRKINLGSTLKRTYFEAVQQAAARVGEDYNPYLVIGSGLAGDVLTAGRLALQKKVEACMKLFSLERRQP